MTLAMFILFVGILSGHDLIAYGVVLTMAIIAIGSIYFKNRKNDVCKKKQEQEANAERWRRIDFERVYQFYPAEKISPQQRVMINELLRIRAKKLERAIANQCKTTLAVENGKADQDQLTLERKEVRNATESFDQALQALKPYAEQLGMPVGESYLDYLESSNKLEIPAPEVAWPL